mgnify:CR=1 FL=1
MNRRKFQIVIILSFIAFSCMYGQSSKDYDILLEQTNNESFPKVLIYDAPVLPINYVEYKKLGFDYISVYSLKDPKSVPNDVKYILWTGVASNDAKSKWSVEKSPFVDDIGQYAKRWNDRLNYYMVTYNNPKDKDDFGIIVLDIESKKNSAELEKLLNIKQRWRNYTDILLSLQNLSIITIKYGVLIAMCQLNVIGGVFLKRHGLNGHQIHHI